MVLNSNPVHAALSLVGTLFGIAVLFVAQEANFLAAVQVIVYAGAIVVLFLFVLMLLGVDQRRGPLDRTARRRPAHRGRSIVGLAVLALPLLAVWSTDGEATGAPPAAGDAEPHRPRRAQHQPARRVALHRPTSSPSRSPRVLLVIAVVGAVVLARKVKRAELIDDPLAGRRAEPRRRPRRGRTTPSEPSPPRRSA